MLAAIVYFCAVWLFSGLMTGLSSFGSNLIAVPLIAFVYDPRESILIGCLASALMFIALALLYRKAIIWRDACLLVLGALAGIPPGIWFLESAGPRTLLLGAGFALILFLIWQYASSRLRAARKPIPQILALPLGLAAGALMGGVGMGGPPMVLYIFLRNYNKEQTISTINAASVGIILGVLPWQFAAGLFPRPVIGLGLLGGLCGTLGILASMPLVKKINLGIFRKLLLAMLALSALMLLARGFGA